MVERSHVAVSVHALGHLVAHLDTLGVGHEANAHACTVLRQVPYRIGHLPLEPFGNPLVALSRFLVPSTSAKEGLFAFHRVKPFLLCAQCQTHAEDGHQ